MKTEGGPDCFGLTLGTKRAPVDLSEVACDVPKPSSDACAAAGWPVAVGRESGDAAKPASVSSSNPAALSARL